MQRKMTGTATWAVSVQTIGTTDPSNNDQLVDPKNFYFTISHSVRLPVDVRVVYKLDDP
jgi:hypothetical protein